MSRILTGAALGALMAASPALADFNLTILHINDLHSRIEPINKYDSTCSAEDDAAGKCFGGVARLKTAIDARRAANDGPLLVLDAGDQFQGSLFYTTYKGEAAVEFMNMIGFDAMAVGNHEFDDGPAALAAFIDKAEFPVLSANVNATGDKALAGKGGRYVIFERDDVKVGVIGLTAVDTGLTSSPGPTIKFEDDLAALRVGIAELERQGVNIVIGLTHVGYPRDLQLAAAAEGLDVIIGGHSHSLLSNTDDKAVGPYPTMIAQDGGGRAAVYQAYAYSKYLGEAQLTFDDAGVLVAAAGDPILVDNSFAPDPAVAARVGELAGPIEALKEKVVGEAAAPIDGARDNCRAQECEMGVLVAEAMLDRVKDQGVDIAIQNGGGLRASIDAGAVTMGEVLTVLPFQNTLATFTLTGAQIVEALENGVSLVEEGAGRFPQVAGLSYSWNPNAPAGKRILAVSVETEGGKAPLMMDKRYGVVSNNFMRKGGDGYAVFTKARDAYDFGPNLEEVVAAYIGARAPYAPRLTGRILRVAAPAPAMAEAPEAMMEKPAVTMTQSAGAMASDIPPPPAGVGDANARPPAELVAPQPAASAAGYVVARGDSLWKIARKQLGDATRWKEIAELNRLANPGALNVGQTLALPAR